MCKWGNIKQRLPKPMNIVIFEKDKLSWPNKLIMCPDYPINKISPKMLTHANSTLW